MLCDHPSPLAACCAGSTSAHRLLRSTSAFLQATLEKRRPTPLIEVRANITLTLPSRLVFSTRRMCWKLDSFMMRLMVTGDWHRESTGHAKRVRRCREGQCSQRAQAAAACLRANAAGGSALCQNHEAQSRLPRAGSSTALSAHPRRRRRGGQPRWAAG